MYQFCWNIKNEKVSIKWSKKSTNKSFGVHNATQGVKNQTAAAQVPAEPQVQSLAWHSELKDPALPQLQCRLQLWLRSDPSYAAGQPKKIIYSCLNYHYIWPYPWHIKVPKLGVELELQLQAYTTAAATPDPSRIHDLHHSSRQCWILYPLSKGKDRTRILIDPSWAH